jgi:Ca2+-binding EF-hand superfamily protein
VNWTPARFARFDNNGDGQITLTEFTANMPLFDRFDADNNGIITQKELSQIPRPW